MGRGIEAFKSGNGLLSQLITVCAGLLTFTVTFVDKFKPAAAGSALSVPYSLKLCWILLVLTVVFGFWALAAITGTINSIETEKTQSGYANINIPTGLMLLCFLGAIIALAVAGFQVAG